MKTQPLLFAVLILFLFPLPEHIFAQNVGIGTTNPSTRLHVLYDSGQGILLEKTNDYPSIQLKEASGDSWTISDNATRLDFMFTPDGGSATTNMTIAESGNIGIGITTPIYDLHVNGTTQTSYLQPGFKSSSYEFIRYGSPSNYFAGIMNNINSTSYGDGDDFTIFTYGNRDIILHAGLGDIFLHPNGGGRVGIGTTTPGAKLDVNGEIRWGVAGASLTSNQGAAIELRGTGSPFIDFSNNASIDYDMRLILTGDDQLAVQGGDLAVIGTFSATRVKVTASGYPDYVFKDGYQLKSLNEVQEFIVENGHLPGVPSEKEIVENGLDLNDQSMWQQEKIEELFLHMIEMDHRVKTLEKENAVLKAEVKHLK